MECWAEIEDFPKYLVSDEGRVVNRRTDRILRPQRTRNGYLIVTLCNESLAISKTVHRLVARAFLDPSLFDLQVNHIDGDKTYNDVSNLELITCVENHKHAFEMGLQLYKGRAIPIRCVETGDEFESMEEAAKRMGTYQSNISHVIQGRRKTANGFHFELIEDEGRIDANTWRKAQA